MKRTFTISMLVTVLFLAVVSAVPLKAASHLWKINELFSNSDGTIQFIELYECCGARSEKFLQGLLFTCELSGNQFTFPANLVEDTNNRYLLLATEGFAALPGAPTPDYIISENFFATDGDVLWYSKLRNYDTFTFEAGDLPTDGYNAIQLTNYNSDTFTTGANSPTNFNGDTGSVDLREFLPPFVRSDCNGNGKYQGADGVTDVVFLLEWAFLGSTAPPCSAACDMNGSGGRLGDDVTTDVVYYLTNAFLGGPPPPEPFPECGAVALLPGDAECETPPPYCQ